MRRVMAGYLGRRAAVGGGLQAANVPEFGPLSGADGAGAPLPLPFVRRHRPHFRNKPPVPKSVGRERHALGLDAGRRMERGLKWIKWFAVGDSVQPHNAGDGTAQLSPL
jgi:hypothetical protein